MNSGIQSFILQFGAQNFTDMFVMYKVLECKDK